MVLCISTAPSMKNIQKIGIKDLNIHDHYLVEYFHTKENDEKLYCPDIHCNLRN